MGFISDWINNLKAEKELTKLKKELALKETEIKNLNETKQGVNDMAETKTEYRAQCMKCRKTMPITKVELIVNKRGMNCATGVCGVCGTKMYRILGKK